MKRLRKFLVFVLILFVALICNNTKTEAYTSSEYDEKVQESVSYAMSLLNDNMTNTEKAIILMQYAQEGNLYQFTSNHQTAKGVLVDHGAVCAGYSDTIKLLFNTAGIPCEKLISNKANHGWNVGNIDGTWYYFDATNGIGDFRWKCNSFRSFETRNSYESVYQYIDPTHYSDTYIANGSFPIPTTATEDKEVNLYSSMVYNDGTYKYYIDSEYLPGWKSYLFKENNNTGEKQKLTEVAYNYNGSGLIKDNNYLYYVDTGTKAIYKMDINGKNNTKVLELTDGNKIGGIYVSDGKMYYGKIDKDNKIVGDIEFGSLTEYFTKGSYTLNNSNQKYILEYLEFKNGIVITKCKGIGQNEPTGTIYIPDYINGKPVVGIGQEAFSNTKVTGILNLPSQLQYICEDAFYKSSITGIKFNNKLKSIGQSAFYGCEKIVGQLNFPASLTYMGESAFAKCSGINEIILNKNLEYIPTRAFENCSGLKSLLEITEGIKKIAYGAFAYSSVEAVILPSSIDTINNPFIGCGNIKDILVKSPNIEYAYNSNANAKFYIPTNSNTSKYFDQKGMAYYSQEKATFANTSIWIDNETTNESNISFVEVEVGTSDTILKLEKSNAFWNNYVVTWSSANTNIAQVDNNGKITGIAEGTTAITAKINGKSVSVTCKVEKLDTIKFDNSNITITKGKSQVVNITSGADDGSKITWKVVNNSVEYDINDAKITKYLKIEKTNNNKSVKITAIDAASSTDNKYKIIAYYNNKYKGTCNVKIDVPLDEIRIIPNSVGISISTTFDPDIIQKLNIDYTKEEQRNFKLKLNLFPSNATIEGNIEYVVGDSTIIRKNSDSSFTVLKGGTTTITAKAYGKESVLNVNVTGDIPITSFVLNKNTERLKKGNTTKLIATINPSGTTRDKTITWKSSNNNVAIVDSNGNVTGKGYGFATITATCGELTASCNVEVRENFFVEKVISETPKIMHSIGIDQYIPAELESGEKVKVNWTSSNPKIVEIIGTSDYWVKNSGTATLTAYDERYGNVKLYIYADGQIQLNNKQYQYIGDLNNNSKFDAEDITLLEQLLKKETLTQDEILIADINGDGLVETFDKILLQKIIDEKLITLKIIELISIDIQPYKYTQSSIFHGDGAIFDIKKTPSNANEDVTYTWSSDNPEIGTVDAKTGKITMYRPGEIKITVTTNTGLSAYCYYEEYAMIEKITLNKSNLNLIIGNSEVLKYTLDYPEAITERHDAIKWSSSNENIAKVDQNGKITAISEGTATITLSSQYAKATCEIIVEKDKPIDIKPYIDSNGIIFDAKYYLEKHPDLKKAYGTDETKAYNHFVTKGINEGRQGSKYFDVKYYLEQNADVQKAYGENYSKALRHFALNGLSEGRVASKEFNVKIYKANYADLQKSYGDVYKKYYIHYITKGYKENRNATEQINNPTSDIDKIVFNAEYYLAKYPDIKKAYGNDATKAYNHFITKGIKEGRQGSIYFNVKYYLEQYPDLQKAYGTDYTKAYNHFVTKGLKEGRVGSSEFNVKVYQANYTDLQKAYGNDYLKYYTHYMTKGIKENRKAV